MCVCTMFIPGVCRGWHWMSSFITLYWDSVSSWTWHFLLWLVYLSYLPLGILCIFFQNDRTVISYQSLLSFFVWILRSKLLVSCLNAVFFEPSPQFYSVSVCYEKHFSSLKISLFRPLPSWSLVVNLRVAGLLCAAMHGCAHTNTLEAAAAAATTNNNATVNPFGFFVCLFLFFLLVSFIYRQTSVNRIFTCYLKIRLSNLFY